MAMSASELISMSVISWTVMSRLCLIEMKEFSVSCAISTGASSDEMASRFSSFSGSTILPSVSEGS